MKKLTTILVLILLTLVSCGDEVEINVGDIIENHTNFQVDFDGETYTADVATAYIHNGITTIIAKKYDTQEFVVIAVNETAIGEYILSPTQNEGTIYYKKDVEKSFITNTTEISGRVDLGIIDYSFKRVTGTFSFVGKRYTQQFDTLGNPMLDGGGNLVFTEEVKTFSNGIFTDIVLALTAPENLGGTSGTNNNEFFVNIDETDNGTDDGAEYVESIVTAHKATEGGFSYITITAKRAGLEAIVLKIPTAQNTGNAAIKDIIVVGDEVVGNYTLNQTNYYTAVNQGTDLLNLTIYNIGTKKLEGTFNFDVAHTVTGEIIHFYGGTFKVTYTE